MSNIEKIEESERIDNEIINCDKMFYFLSGKNIKKKLEAMSGIDDTELSQVGYDFVQKESKYEKEITEELEGISVQLLLSDYIMICCRTLEDLNKLSRIRLTNLADGTTLHFAFSLLDSKLNKKRKIIIQTEADPYESDLFSDKSMLFKSRCKIIHQD